MKITSFVLKFVGVIMLCVLVATLPTLLDGHSRLVQIVCFVVAAFILFAGVMLVAAGILGKRLYIKRKQKQGAPFLTAREIVEMRAKQRREGQ